MDDTLHNVSGSCLCGAVKITVEEFDPHFGACHCTMCQKWGGGPLLAADCGDEVVFDHEDMIATFKSSEWAERGFCKHCGSHLFYHLVASGQYLMPVGLFDLTTKATFDHQIFIDEKPEYYNFANNTAMLTGEQVFAEFTAQDDDGDDHERHHDH